MNDIHGERAAWGRGPHEGAMWAWARTMNGVHQVARWAAWGCLLTVLLVLGPGARAAEPATRAVTLPGLGGVTWVVPAWKEVRRDGTVLMLEAFPGPRSAEVYTMLVATIEAAPKSDALSWTQVRDTIIAAAAAENGSELTLTLDEAYSALPGFLGQRFRGTLRARPDGAALEVALVALARDEKLVTVSLLAERITPEAQRRLLAVAASTTLGAPKGN